MTEVASSGMLWLTRPEEKQDTKLGDAVDYAEQKYGRPVRLILYPTGEPYPATWRDIPMRPSRYVQAAHLFLVTSLPQAATEENRGD